MSSCMLLSKYSNDFNVSPNQILKLPPFSLSLMIQPKLLIEDPRKNQIKEMKQQNNIFSRQLRSNSQNMQTKLPEIKSIKNQDASKNVQIFNIFSKIPVQILNDSFQSPLVNKTNASSQQSQDNNLSFDFEDLNPKESSQREILEKISESSSSEQEEENEEEIKEIEIDQITLKSEEQTSVRSKKKYFRIKNIKQNKLFVNNNNNNNIPAKQLLEESSLNTPLFKIINNEIALLIFQFLNVKDLIKLASVSKESRWTVSYSLQQTNYFKQIEKDGLLFSQKYCIYDPIFRILKRQEEFSEFLKNNKPQLEKAIQEFRKRNFPNKYAILSILAAGILSTRNQVIPDLDVISYINKNGIQQSFSGIMLNFFPQLNISIPLPDFPDDKRSIKLLQLTKFIYNYAKDRIANQLSVQTQRNAFYQITLVKQRQLFMKMRQRIIPIYSKSIMRFGKESRLATMMNKNVFSIILSFLKISEIAVLMQSGKEMNTFVQIALESRVESIKIQKQECLESHKISSELAQALIYHKNLQQFQKEQDGMIHGSKLCYLSLRYLFKIVTFSVSKKEIGEFDIIFNSDNFCRSTFKFQLGKEVPHLQKMEHMKNFLKDCPTQESFMQSFQNREREIKRNCSLLYLGMKSLLMIAEFKLTTKKFMKRDLIYSKNILPLDIIMIQYQKLLGIDVNDEFLEFNKKIVKDQNNDNRRYNQGEQRLFSLL